MNIVQQKKLLGVCSFMLKNMGRPGAEKKWKTKPVMS
jgi:hypothetical protein